MRRHVRWIGVGGLVIVLGAGLPSRAEEPPEPPVTGFIGLGAYWSSDDEYKFGEYTGLGESEWNVLGDFEVRGRPAWDSGETWHFLLRGQNLGLDSRRIDADGGWQGRFRFRGSWDQIPHLLYDDGEIVFHGRGTDLLTLPSDWIAGQTTRGFGALPQSLDPIRIDRERRDLRLGTDTVLPHGFELSTRYLWDRQLGRRPIGSVIGNTGGNPRAVIVPEKIDWDTHNGDVALRWASDVAQAELGYEISHFDDDASEFGWQNPYAAIGGWDPAAGYPSGFGSRALPPDNEFHQVKASGGYDLPFDTRIMTHAAFGWMLQSQNFQDYTVNPALTVTTPLPRDDANAEIETRNLGVRVTSRPLDRLRLLGEWRMDQRDNDTPRDVFIYVPGDSLDQDTISSNRARMNLPQSYDANEGRVEVGYEIFDRTELSAGYRYVSTERSWTEADQVQESIFKTGLHTRPHRMVDFRVDAAWADRDGGDYFYRAPLVWGFSPEHVATVDTTTAFENIPLMRKFTFADRERQSVDSQLNVMPLEDLTLGASLGFVNEDFDDTDIGLRARQALTWGFDLSWAATETITAYAYYTNETFRSRQSGRSVRGGANAVPDAWNPNRNWRQDDEDGVDTVGGGFEWLAIADRLTLRSDLAWSFVKENVNVLTGPALPANVPLPTTEGRLLELSVQAEVQLVEHVKARVGYMFEWLDAEDWAYDDVFETTIPEVLTLGEQNPDYDAHLVGFSLEYEF